MTDKPARHPANVISEMFPHIPEEEADLRRALNSVRQSAMYAAPEMMWQWWQEGSGYLNLHLPPPDQLNEWQRKVIDIWMDKPSHSPNTSAIDFTASTP